MDTDTYIQQLRHEIEMAQAALQQEIATRKKMEDTVQHLQAAFERQAAEKDCLEEKLAKVSRLSEDTFAYMAHELRSPLNVVLGMVESLHSGVYGPLNARMRRCVQQIEDSGEEMLHVIINTLDLFKIRDGKLALQCEQVSVKAICDASVAGIRYQADQKQIAVETRYAPDTILWADAFRLKQVLSNLLSNAIKFTPEQGIVGMEVIPHPDRQIITFCVWDTGPGIPKEDRGRLFQPFEQLHRTRLTHHAGTGLGLSLAALLVELHHGRVSVESVDGQNGSRFIVSLPWKGSPYTINISQSCT